MDTDEEKLIRLTFTQYFNTFIEKVATLQEGDKKRLREIISNFAKLKECDEFIFKKLTEEPFYNIFLNKILTTDYSKNLELLVDSLILFFEAMEELFFLINDAIIDYNSPAGPLDRSMLYNQLIPRLRLFKGKFNLDHNLIYYTPVLKKLSRSLNDAGSLVKTAIYRILRSDSLLKHSRTAMESLDKKAIIKVFKENFDRADNYSKMSRVFKSLKKLISTELIEDFRLKDLFFTFLNKEDVKIIRRLYNMIPSGLNFDLKDTSKTISFSNQGVAFNFNKQVIGLQIINENLEDALPLIFRLKNLRVLNLFNTKIRELPEEIRNLKKLKILNLSENPITEIIGLDSLTSLEELSFFACQIAEIKNLHNLENLTSLILANNKISEIKGLAALINLRKLDLRNNKISEIKGLAALINLEKFCLLNNPVIGKSDVFKHLKILKFRTEFFPSFERNDIKKLINFCKEAKGKNF